MNSLINKAFSKAKNERRPALLTYTVAGDNSKTKSLEILKSISNYADICELGFPHNTPIGDGGEIQTSSYRAIKNGIKMGQIEETESISAGLDYPGVSPLHCFLKDTKRARYTAASDEEALKAYQLVTKYENLNPSLEPSHAFAEAVKIAPKQSKDTIIIVNSCGDAKKDRDILKERLGNN